MLDGVISQASREHFNKIVNHFRKFGIGQMTSNSKNEGFIGSKKL